uniref:Phorbol-ester/DAG-type domain-containing protein n=2 Tax=Noccaea caerulescens TaxID=107243 RepID=A0A1J3F285_NOCCA
MANIWRWIFKPSHGASKPQKLPIHLHFLQPSVFPFDCYGCSETKKDAQGYYCPQCKFYVHKECAESPSEINHPSHSHALKLRSCGPPGYSDGSCRLCGETLGLLVYHCSICNFSLDTGCARKHEIPSIGYPKAHEHRLHLLAKRVSFPCPCGKDVRGAPYLCHQCNFMIHRDCVYLPRVIHLTRHEHRISRSYFIGPGKFVCGVCRLELDGRYGGYRCSVCPDYVIHLRCATREDVWDGIELEGKPEEEEDIQEPFQVVVSTKCKVIKHYSHEDHQLELDEGGVVCHESIRCSACALPVYLDPYYKCSTCGFVLHKTCANLPRKLRHELHKHTLTLRPNTSSDDENGYNFFNCTVCKRLCSGFKYVCECCDVEIDVRCCSIREPFIHESHRHQLFLTCSEAKLCGACNKNASTVLNCVDCEFALGFDCATLPHKVKHKCDTHFLSVCFGEETSGQYWCEVCETRVDPNKRFYTCEDCSTTLHINCVIGEFTFWRPGLMSVSLYQATVLPNVFASRPCCHMCLSRCEDTSGVIYISDKYLCSSKCLEKFIGIRITLSKSPTLEMPLFGQLFRSEQEP